METRVLTAHVPLKLAEKVDQMATRVGRPRAWIVKQALLARIDRDEECQRLTLEGFWLTSMPGASSIIRRGRSGRIVRYRRPASSAPLTDLKWTSKALSHSGPTPGHGSGTREVR